MNTVKMSTDIFLVIGGQIGGVAGAIALGFAAQQMFDGVGTVLTGAGVCTVELSKTIVGGLTSLSNPHLLEQDLVKLKKELESGHS